MIMVKINLHFASKIKVTLLLTLHSILIDFNLYRLFSKNIKIIIKTKPHLTETNSKEDDDPVTKTVRQQELKKRELHQLILNKYLLEFQNQI